MNLGKSAPKMRLLRLDQVTPYENNSRTHPPEQVAELRAALQEFGMAGAVYLWKGTIAKGHGCFEAMKEIYAEGGLVYPAPGEKAGATPFPKGTVPVIDCDGWTEAQFRAFVIADNKLAEKSGWDEALLELELDALRDMEFDTDLTGFILDPDETTEKLVKFGPSEKDDDIPEEPEVPVCQPGDVWQLGKHRIMCGDSTNPDHVAELMADRNGEPVDMLMADPPYGMGKEADGVANDNLYREKLDNFQLSWWSTFRQYLADNGSAYIWGYPLDLFRFWHTKLDPSEELMFKNDIVWNKQVMAGKKSELLTKYPIASEHCLFFVLGRQHFGNVNTDDFFEGWEPVRSYLATEAEAVELTPKKLEELTGVGMFSHWFSKCQWTIIPEKHYQTLKEVYPENFLKPWAELKAQHDKAQQDYRNMVDSERAYFDNTHDAMWDVWDCNPVAGEERHGHATPKPVELLCRAILSSLPEGGFLVEPFLGSGSTLIAAERCERVCYGMELQTAYCDVTIKRWQDYTGKTARRVSDGAYFDELES